MACSFGLHAHVFSPCIVIYLLRKTRSWEKRTIFFSEHPEFGARKESKLVREEVFRRAHQISPWPIARGHAGSEKTHGGAESAMHISVFAKAARKRAFQQVAGALQLIRKGQLFDVVSEARGTFVPVTPGRSLRRGGISLYEGF